MAFAGLTALQRGRLRQLQEKQKIDDEPLASNEPAAGRHQQRGSDWGQQPGEGAHDNQGRERNPEAQWPPRRYFRRAMLLQHLRPTAMALLQRRMAVGTDASLTADSGYANGRPVTNGPRQQQQQQQQKQQDSCQRGRQWLQAASVLPHGRLAAHLGALHIAAAAEQAEAAATADAGMASSEAEVKRLKENLSAQVAWEDIFNSGLLGSQELDDLVDREDAPWGTWRVQVFQPAQVLLDSFPLLASHLRAVDRVAQRVCLQYGDAVEQRDAAEDQRALHVMMAWAHLSCLNQMTQGLGGMPLLLPAIKSMAMREAAAQSRQPIPDAITILADKYDEHATPQQVEKLLQRIDPRLLQPGRDAGDWPLLLQAAARGDDDSRQVASRAVPGLLLLTSIAECSSDEVAPQPMNSIAAAALLNLLQLLLELGPYDEGAPLPLPIGLLFNALKLPPCMLLWAKDVLHAELVLDDLCTYDNELDSYEPLPYEDLRQELQKRYLHSQPGSEWLVAPMRFSPEHVSLVALLASDRPLVVTAMVFALDSAARVPSKVEGRGVLRALLEDGHVAQLACAVESGFTWGPKLQGGWARLVQERQGQQQQQQWGTGLRGQPLAAWHGGQETSSGGWTGEDDGEEEKVYLCKGRQRDFGTGLQGLEDEGGQAEEETTEEEVYYTRPVGGEVSGAREQQLQYGWQRLDSGQETESFGTEEEEDEERDGEDGAKEEEGEDLKQLRCAMEVLVGSVQDERWFGPFRYAMKLVVDVLVAAAKLGLYDTGLQEGGWAKRDDVGGGTSSRCNSNGGSVGVQEAAPSARLAVARAVRSEVEAAAARVSEQLLPLMPMTRILATVSNKVEEAEARARDAVKSWEAPVLGGAKRRGVLELGLVGIPWGVRTEECWRVVEELRPGLLEDPLVGHVWQRALAELPQRRDGFDLLSQAVTGLAAVAGLPLDGAHLHPVPCAVVGALYNDRQQQMMHRQLITRDPADAVEVFRCLLYMSVLPPELDLARSQVAPAAPPDASPPHPRAWAGPTPPPASAAATAATAIAVAHLPGPHRAAYGLLNQLCCFLSDPDGAAAEAACVFDALVPPQGEPVGTSPQQEPQEGPRAACGATQQRVLCAAKLLATRGARQGLPLLSFLAVQGLPHERGGCVLGTRAGIKGGVAPPPAPGLLPPGTQALCGGMDSERLVWALLKIRIMLSNQLARKTRQQQQQQQQEEHGQQAATPRLVAWEPELLTLAAFTLHQDFNLLKGYETVFQPAVDVHLANMLLAGDTPVTEEACYNPAPGTPSLVAMDLHPQGAGADFSNEAWAAMKRCMLDGVTSKSPRFSDALKRLRAALVHSRVGATWVVAQGVGGLQRAMLLAAKVRQELLADERDLLVTVTHAGEIAHSMDAAELRQREEQQQQDPEEGRGQRQRGDAGGRSGGGGGGQGDAGGWLSGPWLSTELIEARTHLAVLIEHLDQLRLEGDVQLKRDGRVECLIDEDGLSPLAEAKDCVETLLRMFATEGCVARSHVRVELLLQVVEKGRVDRPVGQQEGGGGAGVKKAGGNGGGQVAVRGAGRGVRGDVAAKARKQAMEELKKVMFG